MEETMEVPATAVRRKCHDDVHGHHMAVRVADADGGDARAQQEAWTC